MTSFIKILSTLLFLFSPQLILGSDQVHLLEQEVQETFACSLQELEENLQHDTQSLVIKDKDNRLGRFLYEQKAYFLGRASKETSIGFLEFFCLRDVFLRKIELFRSLDNLEQYLAQYGVIPSVRIDEILEICENEDMSRLEELSKDRIPRIKDVRDFQDKSWYVLNCLYIEGQTDDIVRHVKARIRMLPSIKFPHFTLFYGRDQDNIRDWMTSLKEICDVFKKTTFKFFYKAIPISCLESIKQTGLSSRYGGSSGCGQLHERGLMFVAPDTDITTGQFYLKMIKNRCREEAVLLKIRLPENPDDVVFVYNCDWSFAGTIPPENIQFSRDRGLTFQDL